MKIILVSQEYPPETGWGGIGTYTYHLAHGLAAHGHQVRVLSLAPDGQRREYQDGAVCVRRVANDHWLSGVRLPRLTALAQVAGWSFTLRREINTWLEEEPADVIEAPLWNAEVFAYGLRPRTPYAIRAETPHTVYARVNGFDRRWWALNLKGLIQLEKLAAQRAPRLIAISKAVARTIEQDYGVDTERIRICHLGLPLPDRRPPTEQRPDQHGIHYLFVGRLEARKGIDLVFEAIPMVLAALPGARFHIVGKDSPMPGRGTTYGEHFRAANEPRVIAATTLLGHVDDELLQTLYQTCDIFVAPSRYESFGLVHLEAMSYGKPVVACATGATPEIVVSGQSGILVHPDSKALAQALIDLGRDRQLRAQMGQAGLERMRIQFSVEAMVRSTLEIYRELVP
ncbi:MAG: glycosyltransferase family 4 protein [Caldilineaceae bacterium]|nr:glycosyltransferase family 4 protein [Caldilineaceae bacterium]